MHSENFLIGNSDVKSDNVLIGNSDVKRTVLFNSQRVSRWQKRRRWISEKFRCGATLWLDNILLLVSIIVWYIMIVWSYTVVVWSYTVVVQHIIAYFRHLSLKWYE